LKLYRRKAKTTPSGTAFDIFEGAPNGPCLVSSSRDPEHNAARALVARGYTGPFTVYAPSLTEPGRWVPVLRFKSAEAASKWAAQEAGSVGPRFTKWRPFVGTDLKQAVAA
jgi:hypothetical protein